MGRQIRAILFDFDGLIIDTELPVVTAWREIFAEHGGEFPDWCWQHMIGQATPESSSIPYRILEEQTGRTVDRPTIEAKERARRVALIERESPLPGVVGAIDQAKALGLLTAVVSSSDRPWVEGHLARLGVLARFDLIVCGGEAHRSKPDPALYLAALQQLGILEDEAIAIEDSPNGIRAAKGAGIYCIAVPNSLTRELPLDHADRRLDTLEGVSLAGLIGIARKRDKSTIQNPSCPR